MEFAGKLKNKKALVTGAGQGIGKAIAESLLDQGCELIVHYHTSERGAYELLEMAGKLGGKASVVQADLTVEEEVDRLVYETVGSGRQLDILVNNAGGILGRRMIQRIDMDFWHKVIDVNLSSMMMLTQRLIPYLQQSRQSSVVNVASLAGRRGGHAGSLVYATAKGAVLTWTRALATEVAPYGIRVNAVAPGLILGTDFHNQHTTLRSAQQTIETIPLKRAGNVDDVARAVVFLSSEYNGFITGATLDINGGVYSA
jgi:3-oxoacyl-[acyl-carrier protein] reductase